MKPTKDQTRSGLEQITAYAAAGEWRSALQVASRFNHLGSQRDAIQTAYSAIQNPDFYRQIGRDLGDIEAQGIAAIKARFNL